MGKNAKLGVLLLTIFFSIWGIASLPSAVLAAGPSTSTAGLSVITDLESITADGVRFLNISIMGLDEDGNVDTMGEAGGAAIIASVQTQLGDAVSGGATPGAAVAGTFAIVTGYVSLTQGNGMANVHYPNDASGTDVVTIVLYRAWMEIGQWYTEEIAQESLSIPVVAAEPATGILHIRSFTKAATDTLGVNVTAADLRPPSGGGNNEAEDNGLASGVGKMTVNVAGGVFVVEAFIINPDRTYTFDNNAYGLVTLTIGSAGNTCTGTMSEGVANITVPAGFTSAGLKTVAATMGELTSIPHKISDNGLIQDYITILADPTYAGLRLSCNMDTVTNTTAANLGADSNDDGINFDPTCIAYLLDQYGNTTSHSSTVTVTVADANLKIPDFTIIVNGIVGGGSQTSGSKLVDCASTGGTSAGTASLTASDAANALIPASEPVTIKVLPSTKQLGPYQTITNNVDLTIHANLLGGSQLVGTSWRFVQTAIGVDTSGDGDCNDGTEANTLLATDSLKTTNLFPFASESYTVNATDANPDVFNVIFTKEATTSQLMAYGFRIDHVARSYGSFMVYPNTSSTLALTEFTPTKAYVKDAAATIVTNVTAQKTVTGYQVVIDGRRISMEDSYGNSTTSGTVAITTAKGTATAAITVGAASTITLTYPATVSGTDTLTFTFSPVPCTLNDGAGLTVTFPAVGSLASFDAFASETSVSINGLLPLTIIPRDGDGNAIAPPAGFFIDYDSVGLTLRTTAGVLIVTGSNIPSTARYVVAVYAKTTPGVYPITIRDATGTITEEVPITVVESTGLLPVVTISPETASVAIGQTVAFTATTANQLATPVYSWEVAGDCGGSVDNSGVYTAPDEITGSSCVDTVTVTDTANGNISDQATVTVTACEPTVTVSPSTATLQAGETQQFTAETTCDSETLTGVYTWEVTGSCGGSIDNDGLYTAPSSGTGSCTDTVTATDTANGDAEDTATVTVNFYQCDIAVEPSELLRSSWIPLLGLIFVNGTGTDCNFAPGESVVNYSPSSTAITSLLPLVFPPNVIVDLVLVNPNPSGDPTTVTVTVETDGDTTDSDTVTVKTLLPGILSE